MAEGAGVRIVDEVDSDLPSVRGDSVKLRQVFTNLVSNALKFTHSGGEVRIKAGTRPDGHVVVEVADTGIGMSERDISVAMTPFGQVDSSHARWREGTGLGLPIAKALTELHGGELAIESREGEGTTVKVILPPRGQLSVSEARDAVMGQGLPT
jgi:two-component system cell cycle sensor histidine kinase PleC